MNKTIYMCKVQKKERKDKHHFYAYLLSCKNALSLYMSCRASSDGSLELPISSLRMSDNIFSMLGFRETGTKHEQPN
jgi:hypothetical protein